MDQESKTEVLPARIAEDSSLPSTVTMDSTYMIDAQAFEHGQRVAKLFAAADMVPDIYKGKVANCFIACEMASRMRVPVLAFMQHSYVVHGKPSIDGILVSAVLNASGLYKPNQHPKPFYEGQGEKLKCFARGITLDGSVEEAECSVETAKKEGWWDKNIHWRCITEQMLWYRAVSFLGKKYHNDLLLGLPLMDEVVDAQGVAVVRGQSKLSVKLVSSGNGNASRS